MAAKHGYIEEDGRWFLYCCGSVETCVSCGKKLEYVLEANGFTYSKAHKCPTAHENGRKASASNDEPRIHQASLKQRLDLGFTMLNMSEGLYEDE